LVAIKGSSFKRYGRDLLIESAIRFIYDRKLLLGYSKNISNKWLRNDRESSIVDYYCLESDFGSTWVQIKVVLRSPRFTQLLLSEYTCGQRSGLHKTRHK